jgi:hypothetical protein
MRHSLSEGVDLRLVVRELKERLLPRLDVDTVAPMVAEYLKKLQPPLPPIEILAIGIARHLLSQPMFNRRDLESVINNRPAELGLAVERSDQDEYRSFARRLEQIAVEGRPISADKTKSREDRKKASARRYERKRRYQPLSIGQIEREFGESRTLSPLLPEFERSQMCIDPVLTGGMVDMSTLESWFGRDRKLLPDELRGTRRGRKILYGYRSVARCFEELLADRAISRCWPRQFAIRSRAVTALIERVESRARGKTKRLLLDVLRPHAKSGAD